MGVGAGELAVGVVAVVLVVSVAVFVPVPIPDAEPEPEPVLLMLALRGVRGVRTPGERGSVRTQESRLRRWQRRQGGWPSWMHLTLDCLVSEQLIKVIGQYGLEWNGMEVRELSLPTAVAGNGQAHCCNHLKADAGIN